MYHLTGPVLLLISSCLTLSFVVSLGGATAEAIGGENPIGWWILITYALSFGPATVYSTVYWTKERTRGVSLPRCWAWGHLYALYGLMWYAAGWWALGRVIKGSNSWAKTERLAEAAEIVGAS